MSLLKNKGCFQGDLREDGKILESAFRIEALFKKYYRVMLLILAVVLICIACFAVLDYREEKRIQRVAAIFDQIQQNGLDEELLKKMQKEGGEAYDFVALSWALQEKRTEELENLKKSSNLFIAKYAGYELGSMQHSFDEKEDYGEFANLVFLQQGYEFIKNKNYQEATKKLDEIKITSPFRDWALRIGHYGISF